MMTFMSSDASKRIIANPAGLARVLKDNHLKVPPNQREYSWEADHVSAMLKDLGNAFEEGDEYFLGTIVTIRHRDSDHLEVVDGQQRLATTAIILAAVRDYLVDKDESLIVESINK